MSDLSFNRVSLSANLVCEPELRELAGGEAVCFMRVRCETGQRFAHGEQYRASYFDVLMLGPRARRSAQWLHTGHRVVIHGRLESECWDARARREQERVTILAEWIRRADLPGEPCKRTSRSQLSLFPPAAA
jgi:single-stranded DNA-binding protein